MWIVHLESISSYYPILYDKDQSFVIKVSTKYGLHEKLLSRPLQGCSRLMSRVGPDPPVFIGKKVPIKASPSLHTSLYFHTLNFRYNCLECFSLVVVELFFNKHFFSLQNISLSCWFSQSSNFTNSFKKHMESSMRETQMCLLISSKI